jgi:metallo-beta-lactamase class B
LAPNSYQHISYLKTNDFGNVPCNGLVVVDDKEAIDFQPTDDKGSEELILWLTATQKCKIKAIIPTHFHDDCLGGLGIFEKYQIPSYANEKPLHWQRKTIQFYLKMASKTLFAGDWS